MWDGETWTGLFWFSIGTGGGFFVNVVMNLHFRKFRIISCLAEDLLGSQEGFCCIECMG